MKHGIVVIIVIMAVADSVLAQQARKPVAVPDEQTAVTIAEKALAKVYGKKQIESEKPFTATLRDGVWHVGGTIYRKVKQGNVFTGACVGGVAMADIRQSDGRVLKTAHTK